MELTSLRDAIVGLPGLSGLSVEQRKRLTIGVELVANPSIVFMDVSHASCVPSQGCCVIAAYPTVSLRCHDAGAGRPEAALFLQEPTSGLDARAAAIVMRCAFMVEGLPSRTANLVIMLVCDEAKSSTWDAAGR